MITSSVLIHVYSRDAATSTRGTRRQRNTNGERNVMLKRFARLAGLATSLLPGLAGAEPIDTWEITPGYDCVADLYNPIRGDGTRDLNGDPLPGTAEWDARQDEHTACTDQRD